MTAYNKTNLIRIRNGLFQDATAVQIDTCRLAALMVEPRMFALLAERSDPGQGRAHCDNPNLRAQTLLQECMQELTRLHNDVNYVPQHRADVTEWCPNFFICIAQPAEARDFAWIATTFRTIKTTMGTLINNFNTSGNLENDTHDATRDTAFFSRFCNKQPMHMYIYMLWDHGRSCMLAWNCIMLPDEQRLEIGLPPPSAAIQAHAAAQAPQASATAPADPASCGRAQAKRARRNAGDPSDTGELLDISRRLLDVVSSPASTATAPTGTVLTVPAEVAATSIAQALAAQADLLKDQLKSLPQSCDDMRPMLSQNLCQVLRKLCHATGGVVVPAAACAAQST